MPKFIKSMEYIVVIIVHDEISIYNIIDFDELQNHLVAGQHVLYQLLVASCVANITKVKRGNMPIVEISI